MLPFLKSRDFGGPNPLVASLKGAQSSFSHAIIQLRAVKF